MTGIRPAVPADGPALTVDGRDRLRVTGAMLDGVLHRARELGTS